MNLFFSKIKIVAIDFDDTLVDEKKFLAERWKKVLNKYLYLSDDLEQVFFRIFEQKGPKYSFLLNETFQEINLNNELIPEIVSEFRVSTASEVMLPGVIDFLSFIQDKKIKTGIITNGVRSYQERRIENAGIYKYLDFVYFGDLYKKPDVRAFEQCIHAEQVPVQEILYIGNHYEEDIVPALKLGMKVVWITNNGGISKKYTDSQLAIFDSFLYLSQAFKKASS